MSASWPLVAREGLLRRVVAAVRDRMPGVVMSGLPGVGKTRLLRAAVDELARMGVARPHWVQASEAAASLPFGAVAHLMPDPSDALTGQVEVLHQARAALLAEVDKQAQRGGRMVLAVDDAHFLDRASATLVGYLVASKTGTVLLTLRSGVAAPDAIQGLVESEQLEQLELDVLAPEAVAELLARVLGGHVDSAAARQFYEASEGNPLRLRELVTDARRRGTLYERDGLWRLASLQVSPQRLGDLVGARLAELDRHASDVVCAVALGGQLEAALLEAVSDPAALQAVDRAGLLEAVPDPEGRRQQVRLVHPLYAEAARVSVAPLQARELYRGLADALQAMGARRRGDGLRLAKWQLEGGQGGDQEVFLAAAMRAQAAFDHRLAERLARAALQAGAGFPAKLTLNVALRWQGRTEEADTVVANWKTEASSDAQRAQAALSLAETMAGRAWQPERVDALLTEAAALVTDPNARRRLLASRATSELFQQWRIRDALRTATPLVAGAQADPYDSLEAVVIAVAAATLAGQGEWAIATANAVLARRPHNENRWRLLVDNLLLQWSALAHVFAGRLLQAQQLASEQHRLGLDQRIPELQAIGAGAYGYIALVSGRVLTASRWLREAAALSRSHLRALGEHPTTWNLGCLAQADALRGELATAEAALAEARGNQALPDTVPVASTQLAPAWITAARGEFTAARHLATAAADVQRAVGAHAFEAVAVHDAVRLGATGTELRRLAERLQALSKRVDGKLITAFAAHARALDDRNPAALQNASAEFERQGTLLHAAEAAAQLAELHREAGRESSAYTAAARAHTLGAHCEGARTPALADPLPLTPREREIATLAAQGLSNKQIAERLVISERTAGNHLHRAYIKLGVTGRRELQAIIAP